MPDFQQFYGLRLSEVVTEWHPREALLLIAGLPDESRFFGRLMGEERARGWSVAEWVLLDVRNAVEALRVMKAGCGEFREWKKYPGEEVDRAARARRVMDGLRARLGKSQRIEVE